jgi:Uma2 family endonuclease
MDMSTRVVTRPARSRKGGPKIGAHVTGLKPSVEPSTNGTAPGRLELVLGDDVVQIPREAWTLSGFRKWAVSEDFPQRGRITFIAGELIVDMSPEEAENHVKVKGEFAYAIMTINKHEDLGEFYGDGLLVTNEDADLSSEPDGTLILHETFDSARAILVPREGEEGEYMELLGTPDLVLEVASKFSMNKDYNRLRQAYHLAGIPEYWLVNARGKKLDFQILHHRPEGYVAGSLRGGWQRSDVLRRDLRLVREKNRRGLWRYTLESRVQ